MVKPTLLVFTKRDWRGVENLPAEGGVIVAANHVSELDPLVLAHLLHDRGRPPRFLAKAELFDIPLFGRLIRALNARPVRREGSDARALKTALKVLEEGRALLVFPEGTRGPEGVLREAKHGAGMLAVLSGAVVVPVLITGSGRALPRGAAFPRPAKAVVRFGPPMRFKTTGEGERETPEERKDAYRAATDEMMRAIAQLQRQAA